MSGRRCPLCGRPDSEHNEYGCPAGQTPTHGPDGLPLLDDADVVPKEIVAEGEEAVASWYLARRRGKRLDQQKDAGRAAEDPLVKATRVWEGV